MSISRFHVGAAVGSGMAARAAERAGADFILALGAGKLRSMGIASPASLLPIYDAVEFTIEFATSELLPRVKLPIYVGLPLFDPRIDRDAMLTHLKTLGIRGLTNFPAAFHFGPRARVLDEHGLGLDREIRFLKAAARTGLDPIGYVRNRTEANAMVSAGIRTLCINFGLNPPTADDADHEEKANEITLAAREIVDSVRRPNRNLTIYLGGGPVSGGASLDRLCRDAGIDGFIGGSAMDRAPLEKSILNTVASFREIEVLQNRVQRLERKLQRASRHYGIVCQSVSMNRTLDQAEAATPTGAHVLISGESDTGRMDLARIIVNGSRRGRRRNRWEVRCSDTDDTLAQLFGRTGNEKKRRRVGVLELANAREPVVVSDVHRLSEEGQERLKRFLSEGDFAPCGSDIVRRSDARVILIAPPPTASPFSTSVAALLEHEIAVPALRDRIEDIPLLAQTYASELGHHDGPLQAAVIRTLLRHNWPENLGELRRAIRWLVLDKRMLATEEELIAHIGYNRRSAQTEATISQRDRIIQALLLNNLNRSKTAAYLGISRKTLYNQIKKFEILS